ncbi:MULTISPECIES: hypothetical protein [unclassified Geodermatophilus]
MSIPTVRPPGQDGREWPEPDPEDFDLVFAAWALLLTVGLLTGAVVAVWALAGWPVSGP